MLARDGSRQWSMTARFTLYFSVATVLLLAATSLVLYWGLQRSLQRQNENFVDQKVQILRRLLHKRPFDRIAVEQEVFEEAGISHQSHSPFYLRVLDAPARVLVETPGMSRFLPADLFPAGRQTRPQTGRVVTADRHSFLVTAVSVPDGAPASREFVIQAAFDISADDVVLRAYERGIIVTVLTGSLLAAVIAAWISRRGLRPIADITHLAERVGARQLHERLGTGRWPRELTALAVAFDRMLDRLQEGFDRLSQFSADLAHELRNPINNLIGEAQVALSRARSPAEYERVLQSGLEEHERLARMIESMLFLAQSDQSRTALRPERLDARSELAAVAEFYQPLADERRIELLCEGEGHVVADPSLLRRALSNLLSNALKYSPEGSSIALRVGRGSDDRLRLGVTDRGIGIAAAHLPRLGDRFYRVDASRTDSPGGAGLGLAIVKSIMALHGGELSIDSAPGSGTTATLIFPR